MRNASDVQLDDLPSSTLERRIGQFDATLIVSTVFTYELPFGRNRRYLAELPRIADVMALGWSLSGTFTTRTGFPVDGASMCPVTSPTPVRPISNIAMAPLLNRGAFPLMSLSAYDIRTCSTRMTEVRFPRLLTTDLSVGKQFARYKSLQWQLRADIFNTFNHPYFTTLLSSDVSNANFGLLSPTQKNDPRVLTFCFEGTLLTGASRVLIVPEVST